MDLTDLRASLHRNKFVQDPEAALTHTHARTHALFGLKDNISDEGHTRTGRPNWSDCAGIHIPAFV